MLNLFTYEYKGEGRDSSARRISWLNWNPNKNDISDMTKEINNV